MNQKDVAISLVGVTKSYNQLRAVDGINLQVHSGDFIVIMGPSGCGKTTTLRIIAGLETPDSGDVFIAGRQVTDVKPWNRDVPLVWQNFALFPHLNVYQNVEYGLRMRNIPAPTRAKKVRSVLQTVGLQAFETRSVLKLSGGQKQRVGLARALVLDPKVLLLDEPLGALDTKIARSMQQELRRLHKLLGITFVYVTHNQSEAMALATHIVVMNDGKIQQIGTPQEIFRTPQNKFVADFTGANNILTGKVDSVIGHCVIVSTSAGKFSINMPNDRRIGPQDPVTFVVSADRVRIDKENGELENSVLGRVTAVEVMGSVVTIYASPKSADEFQAQMSALDFAKSNIEVDGTVRLSWKPEDAYLLPGV